MAQWLAETLPRVPESYGRITSALSVIALVLACLRAVVRRILGQRSKPRR